MKRNDWKLLTSGPEVVGELAVLILQGYNQSRGFPFLVMDLTLGAVRSRLRSFKIREIETVRHSILSVTANHSNSVTANHSNGEK